MKRISSVICLLMSVIFISCVPVDPCEAWTVTNKMNSGITVYTIVWEGDDAIMCPYIPAAHIKPNVETYVYTTRYDTRVYEERMLQLDRTTLYFNIDGMECNDQYLDIEKSAIAFFMPDTDWFLAYVHNITFPDDCTVNPDLWKIYDLDKFVERYGPLNAQGWDEVWQKWEQAKAER